MIDRVCVVTGASSGIGRAAALELARRGARVALVCRDPAKGEQTRAAIRSETGSDAVDLLQADLSSQRQVRALAEQILARYPQLHVLLNNAGIVNTSRSLTEDGVEAVFAVNHLAYFLLTNLLLARLRESPGARVVSVSSEAHRFVRGIRFDDPGFAEGWSWWRVYAQSKLANILFTRELARRLEGSDNSATCLHPGGVATGLGQNNGAFLRGLSRPIMAFLSTPERGARTSIYLASSPDVAGRTGRYFAKCREKTASSAARDDDAARRLWALSEQMTGLRTEGAL